MVDFTQRAASVATVSLNDTLSALLDEAIAAASKAEYEAGRGSGEGEVAKKRVGAGYIGTECARELAFRYHKHPKEDRPSVVSPGELNRHGQAGHWTEAKTAEWLRLIGFDLTTFVKDADGQAVMDPFGKPKQIGWKAARDPASGQYRMAGEVDGVIHGIDNAALAPLIKVPAIWESKKATDKKWKKFSKEGVRKSDPKYYGQLQTNMAYMGVENTLFSMLNLDNMKYYFEIVPFNKADAQAISDRAVKVLDSETAFDMPRLGRTEDDFVCKYCDFHAQCWKGLVIAVPAVSPAMQAALDNHAKAVGPGAVRHVFNPNFPVT